jgi:hypothetical protein
MTRIAAALPPGVPHVALAFYGVATALTPSATCHHPYIPTRDFGRSIAHLQEVFCE